jgi:putative addiction module component (TIGR02574 family)
MKILHTADWHLGDRLGRDGPMPVWYDTIDALQETLMPVTIASLGLDKLPREDRLALAQELLDSVAEETRPPELTEAQLKELLRRADEDDANPNDVIPWEEVKAKARAGFKS